jgi:sulfite exporter TauE/SafE
MSTLLVTVFVASLVGSLHCVGMCGPFVAFYAGGDGSGGARRLASHGIYSLGRLVAYVVLGAAAGAIGAALDLAGSLAGFQRIAAIAAGTIMVAWGVLALLSIRGVRLFPATHGAAGGRWIRNAFRAVADQPPVVRAASVGLLTGLLPCGWLWAFLVTAAGTGGALTGVAVMAAFWLGTVPALVALGLGAQLIAAPLRRHVPAATAVLLVALGVFAIVSRPASVAAGVAERERAAHTAVPAPGADHSCCGD